MGLLNQVENLGIGADLGQKMMSSVLYMYYFEAWNIEISTNSSMYRSGFGDHNFGIFN